MTGKMGAQQCVFSALLKKNSEACNPHTELVSFMLLLV